MFFRSQCGQAEGQSEDTLKAVMIGVSSTEGPLYQKHGEGCRVGEGMPVSDLGSRRLEGLGCVDQLSSLRTPCILGL